MHQAGEGKQPISVRNAKPCEVLVHPHPYFLLLNRALIALHKRNTRSPSKHFNQQLLYYTNLVRRISCIHYFIWTLN